MNLCKDKIIVAVILQVGLIFFRSVSGSDQFAGDTFSNGFFISEIFNKYGVDNFITYEGFEHLLENLGLGKLKFDSNHDVSMHRINGTFLDIHDELSLHRHNRESFKTETDSAEMISGNETTEAERKKRNLTPGESHAETSMRQKCLTPQDMLITFGLEPPRDVISPEKYLQICPAIIYELDQKLCQQDEDSSGSVQEPKDYRLVWTYASVSILVMGLSGVLCVLMVPLIGKDTQFPILQFLISLATGTLCGDALIHLLPQVFSKIEQENGSEFVGIFKGTAALLAIFLFFFVEGVLKECKSQKRAKNRHELDRMLTGENVEQVRHMGHTHSTEINSVAWMAILGDILHNVTDGLSIGAAFTTRLSAGFASSIAIFCHELPHELGDYAIFLASGMTVRKSLFYNVLSSIFSFFGMIVGILLGEFKNASLWINSITAGSFLYVALTDLLPEMKTMSSKSNTKSFMLQVIGFFCGGALMLGIALYEDKIEAFLC